jgi:hypothetical protein
LDLGAVVTFISDLQPGAERANCGKIFDRETNGLCGGGKATIPEALPHAGLSLSHEKIGRRVVVKRHEIASPAKNGTRMEEAFTVTRRG